MNEFDFDEVMESVTNATAENSFRKRLLHKSQKTLTRTRFKRRAIRTGGIFSCILLIAFGAFLCGRFSGGSPGKEICVAIDDDNVVVSAELVAWLDAGKFFEQIGMHDRATNAYKTASKMIPEGNLERHTFATEDTIDLAALLQRVEAAAIENEKMESMNTGNCMLATITIHK